MTWDPEHGEYPIGNNAMQTLRHMAEGARIMSRTSDRLNVWGYDDSPRHRLILPGGEERPMSGVYVDGLLARGVIGMAADCHPDYELRITPEGMAMVEESQ